MRTLRLSGRRPPPPTAADEAPCWLRGITRGAFGFLLALAVLPCVECAAAGQAALTDVAGSASTADPLTRDPDQWSALERASEEQEEQRVRAALAPEQWVAMPIRARHGGVARKGPR